MKFLVSGSIFVYPVKYRKFGLETEPMSEDEEAVAQEREENAEPDIEPVEEIEEDEMEEEVEVDNEERESERIEEREDDMLSTPKKEAGKSKKQGKRTNVAKRKKKSR